LFLFDTAAARDWAGIEEEVRRLCSRIGAELLVCVKFDERKLTYEIARRKRGTYVLVYFDAPPDRIADLERDLRLSELILRGLVVRAEKLTEERLAQLRAHPAETPLAPLGGEGRRHDEERRGTERRPREGEPEAPVEPEAEVAAPAAESAAESEVAAEPT
jgi:small subunit ribosomal protein S6